MSDGGVSYIDLLRHGEPVGGKKFRGVTDDPLTDEGWRQMDEATDGIDSWEVIISSPLKRCSEYAENIAEKLKIPVTIEDRFREINFGAWEGKTSEYLLENDGKTLSQFWEDPMSVTPVGGEPFKQFSERVLTIWQETINAMDGKNCVVICHGGVIKIIVGDILGLTVQEKVGFDVPYASLSRIKLTNSGNGKPVATLVSHGDVRP